MSNDKLPMEEGGTIDGFTILDQIGNGAFSHVHIAKHNPTENYCAVKIVDLSRLGDEEIVGMIREITVFLQVDHQNIVSLYRLSTYEKNLFLFMEYATKGTLMDYVNSKGGLNEFEAKRIFIQLFSAVRYLHVFHFLVHRDLKLENVLLDEKMNVKLADFGLAGSYYNYRMRTFVGTAGYQAPEILISQNYDEKCDVWSLGVCLYAMLTASLPFTCQNSNPRALITEAANLKYPSNFSQGLIDLLNKMLSISVNERPTLLQLQTHPWLKGLVPLKTNIAPTPTIFCRSTSISAISKMVRKAVGKPDEKALQKCIDYGLNEEKLKEDLKSGVQNDQTTVYYIFLHPLGTKPEPPVHVDPPQIIDKSRKKCVQSSKGTQSTDKLPILENNTSKKAAASPSQRAILNRTIGNRSVPIISGEPKLPMRPGNLRQSINRPKRIK